MSCPAQSSSRLYRRHIDASNDRPVEWASDAPLQNTSGPPKPICFSPTLRRNKWWVNASVPMRGVPAAAHFLSRP
jgi:hypothetical protein